MTDDVVLEMEAGRTSKVMEFGRRKLVCNKRLTEHG
jgi:hypothetical protein